MRTPVQADLSTVTDVRGWRSTHSLGAVRGPHLPYLRSLVLLQDEKDTPLLLAARYGHDKLVEPLLDAGSDIEERNMLGSTSLLAAAMNGHTCIVRSLLRRGAKVDAAQASPCLLIKAWVCLYRCMYTRSPVA